MHFALKKQLNMHEKVKKYPLKKGPPGRYWGWVFHYYKWEVQKFKSLRGEADTIVENNILK